MRGSVSSHSYGEVEQQLIDVVICLLAGPAASVDKAKPYTTGVLGRALIDFSDQPVTKALQLKVIGNTFILNMIEHLSEAFVLAEKSGLGTEHIVDFVEAVFPGPYVEYAKRMTSGDYHKREEPLFAVDLARKDARHAMALAEEHGTRLKDIEIADKHLERVKEKIGARGDIASIYGAVREEGGLKFENS
jgi:3-hydroxyisobutyrate dehydrogenase-like beta-hydroxyacid dehydrogenase